MDVSEFVRFDEHENPFVISCFGSMCAGYPTLPTTSSTNTASGAYPTLGGPDVGGWMYLNLDNRLGPSPYSVTAHPSGTITAGHVLSPFGIPRASQNWVTISMFGTAAGSRMTAELDAAPLGNGCTPVATLSTPPYHFADTSGLLPIGPAGGVFVCPPGTTLTNGTTALCTGTNANPNP